MGSLNSRILHLSLVIILVLISLNIAFTEKIDTITKPANVTNSCVKEDGTPVNVTESMISKEIFNTERGRQWDRPVKDATQPINVNVYLRIHRLIEVNERNQLVRINGFFSFSWIDELRRWDHMHPYNCVDYLVVPHGPDTGLWIPEIAMINTDSRYSVTADKDEQVRIWSDGWVALAPGGLIEFLCEMDLAKFPFDEQVCNIRLEPWRYSTKYMAFGNSGIEAVNLTYNEQWDITKLSYKLDEASYPSGYSFSSVDFYIYMRRKPGYYLFTVIMPCLLVAAVEIFTFSIPYNKGIRLEVSFTCLLAFTVFHTMVISQLPKSADHPPLLMILISILTYLIGFAIFFQSITLFMAAKADEAAGFPSRVLYGIAISLAPCLLLSPLKYNDTLAKAIKGELSRGKRKGNIKVIYPKAVASLSKPKMRKIIRSAWQFTARVTDRCFCLMFITLFGIGACSILVIVPAVGRR